MNELDENRAAITAQVSRSSAIRLLSRFSKVFTVYEHGSHLTHVAALRCNPPPPPPPSTPLPAPPLRTHTQQVSMCQISLLNSCTYLLGHATLRQEAHGPRVAHLSDIATADTQMLCNIFPILSSQLMKRSSFKQFFILKKIYGMPVN